MRAVGLLSAALIAIAVVIAGCGGGDSTSTDTSKPELIVFAASSLGPAFERYGHEFSDADVKFSFAGSDDLAAQIRQGVAPDVYAAANTSLPDDLAKDGFLNEPQTFATNRLVVGVPAGSDINDISDLETPGTTVAMGSEEVPVGIYTREVLKALGPSASQAILDNVASNEPDVAGIVGKLTQGAVDAGFVYRSDVEASDRKIVAVQIPKSASPDVSYAIAATTDATQPALAGEYVKGALSGDGQQILLESGFGPPPK